MIDAYIDADVIIRLLAGDDPDKQSRAAILFERVEQHKLTLTIPLTTIADVVFVLSSPKLFALSREQVAALLEPLLRLRDFRLAPRRVALVALQLFAASNVDFGDAVIAAAAKCSGTRTVYSFDHDFDRLVGMKRVEP